MQWAKDRNAHGEVPLLLFDFAVGGMAVLLITSWLDQAMDPDDAGGGDVSVLVWSIAAAASIAVGMTSVRRRAAAST